MTTATAGTTFWELLEAPAANVEAVTDLLRWSMNYNVFKGTPYQIFLDLIGYSDEHFGESMFKGNPRDVLGYLEISYLADALEEYATNPQEVSDWIDKLMEAEANE
jgi:hypothetical protein